MSKPEVDNEDEMISAVFAPIEKKLVCGQLGSKLQESKTSEKPVKDIEDPGVTWTSLSDVCSAFLKAADAAGKDPAKELANLPMFNKDDTIRKPVAGGGNESAKSVIQSNKTITEETQKDNSDVHNEKKVKQYAIENKTSHWKDSSQVALGDSRTNPITIEDKKQEIVTSVKVSEEAMERDAGKCVKPKTTNSPSTGNQQVSALSHDEESKVIIINKCSTPITNMKELKVDDKSGTPITVITKPAPLSRNHVNVLKQKPLIKIITTTTRKRKTMDKRVPTSRKRIKYSRFSKRSIRRGLYSTPVNSPRKVNGVVLTPLKIRKQKISVPRHLRPFLTKLQLGCPGIKQLVRCREKLDLLKDTEWEKRLVCLEYISNIVALGQVTELEMVEEMRELKRGLKKSVEDLRSKIVKCVAETIMILAEFLGNRFLPFFRYLFPSMLKGLYVTVRIIRESHDRCISECVKAITEPRILKILLDKRYVRDQHREVRFKTGALLVDFLNRFLLSTASETSESRETKFAPYRRHTKELLKTVKILVSDQNTSVRETAKELLEAARICLAEKDVSSWLSTLSSDTKKRLLH